MKKTLIIIWFLLGSNCLISGQNDSLSENELIIQTFLEEEKTIYEYAPDSGIELVNQFFLDEMPNDLQKVELLLLKSNCEYYNDDLHGALQSVFTALPLSRQVENIDLELLLYIQLSNIHFSLREFEEMKKALDEAGKFIEMTDDLKARISYRGTLAIYYTEMKDFDKAVNIFQQILLELKKDGKENSFNAFATRSNLANVLYAKEDYLESVNYYLESYRYLQKEGGEYNMFIVSHEIGSCYLQLNQLDSCEFYYNKSLNHAILSNSTQSINGAYDGLKSLFVKQKKYKEAVEMSDSSMTYYNKYLDEQKVSAIEDVKGKYELSQKDIEIENSRLSIEKGKAERENLLVLISSGLALLLVAMVMIVQKRKANKEILSQNEKIQTKNDLIEAQNIQIGDSINYAKNIQQKFIKSKAVFNQYNKNGILFFQPKDTVSGDFYWFKENETHQFYAVADCTGHGVSGAFISLICINILNNNFKNDTCSPSELIHNLNNDLFEQLNAEEYKSNGIKEGLEISVVAINKKSKEVLFSGSRQKVYLISLNKEIERVTGEKMDIGTKLITRDLFKDRQLILKKGDYIVLFTDGYVDQIGGEKYKKFFYQPFRDLCQTFVSTSSSESEKLLSNSFHKWKGSNKQMDDVTVMGIYID